MARFDDQVGGSAFSYGLPTPGTPNIRFEDEVQCEKANTWAYGQPVTDICYQKLDQVSKKKKSTDDDFGPDRKKKPVQAKMENFFLLQGSRPTTMKPSTTEIPRTTTVPQNWSNSKLNASRTFIHLSKKL
jgi:hypothetical protein